MKIFLLINKYNNDYDTYDSVVVVAKNEEEAKKIHPNGTYNYEEGEINPYMKSEKRIKKADSNYGTWIKKEFVEIKEIGTALPNSERGVICASFNAG